jgi:hypothetical protein
VKDSHTLAFVWWQFLFFFPFAAIFSLSSFLWLVGNGLQLRNVGRYGALSCPPLTKVATKNKPCGNHYLPHVFLGAVMGWFLKIEVSKKT